VIKRSFEEETGNAQKIVKKPVQESVQGSCRCCAPQVVTAIRRGS